MNFNYLQTRVRSIVSVEYRSMIFAEALAQSLEAGISVYDSMRLLEDCMLPWILIPTLAKTVEHMRAGGTLSQSLQFAQQQALAKLSKSLLVSIELGEEKNRLSAELNEWVASRSASPAISLASYVGRATQVRSFSLALARCLHDEPLSPHVILDAAKLADPDQGRFYRGLKEVAMSVAAGSAFDRMLADRPQYFDRFLCRLISSCNRRKDLLRVLIRSTGLSIPTSIASSFSEHEKELPKSSRRRVWTLEFNEREFE